MQQAHTTFQTYTNGIGLYEITTDIKHWVQTTDIENGLLTLLVQHTSASLIIQENADPDVQRDLIDALDQIAPMNPRLYRHTAEGPDDMPAHIKSTFTNVSLSIPVLNSRLRLGTWQGVYLAEHRTNSHTRQIAGHILGN